MSGILSLRSSLRVHRWRVSHPTACAARSVRVRRQARWNRRRPATEANSPGRSARQPLGRRQVDMALVRRARRSVPCDPGPEIVQSSPHFFRPDSGLRDTIASNCQLESQVPAIEHVVTIAPRAFALGPERSSVSDKAACSKGLRNMIPKKAAECSVAQASCARDTAMAAVVRIATHFAANSAATTCFSRLAR